MEEQLWSLIMDEAEAIKGYYDVLSKAADADMEPIRETINLIIADERDHLEALKFLYSTITKNKIVTDALDYAKEAQKEYKNRNRPLLD
jgi:rubrerythrin